MGIVGIGGDEIGDADTALLEADEELAPVDPGLGEGAGDNKDDALALIPPYSNGNEGGGKVRHPGGGDLKAAEFSHDLGDTAGATPPESTSRRWPP